MTGKKNAFDRTDDDIRPSGDDDGHRKRVKPRKIANIKKEFDPFVSCPCVCCFLARAYAVDLSPSSLASFAVTIALLSLATPGVPGAGIIMLATVLKSINVPVESIGLILGISSLLGMIQTMSNTTGDIATTLIVAKSEKLLDEEVYNR